MAKDVTEFYKHFQNDMSALKKEIPETLKGFGNLFSSVMKDGALTAKEKEMVALGISVALRCEPCINLHVKKCLETGVSREQILEAASVAVMMQGGPGYTYLPVVLDALEACAKA